MNVFVLSTGRSGTMTIAKVFAHATNLTSGHETAAGSFYPLDYPADHLEADNRLSWMLGALHERFPDALYVHLIRDREQVARSFEARRDYPGASIRGFGAGILGRGDRFPAERYQAAETVRLEELPASVPRLWWFVGAQGDLDAAVAEASVHHNAQLNP